RSGGAPNSQVSIPCSGSCPGFLTGRPSTETGVHMPESLQHKLDRVRPPRVQITYDVEIGGAIQKKELPFVVGIMADLCGKPENAPPPLKERKFVEIDRDNFNDVLASIVPRLALQVENPLSKDGAKQSVELKFRHIDDFGPLNIIDQVASLKKLY